MRMRSVFCCGSALATVAVLTTACVRPTAVRSAVSSEVPVNDNGAHAAGPVELLVDAEIGSSQCGPQAPPGEVAGFARMKVRDGTESGDASELEYELFIENADRRRLAGAALLMQGVGAALGPSDAQTVVLWAGETSDKQRLRMRGIVALPKGVSTAEFDAALRERRGALQVRISDDAGTAAGCGELRN